jgi:hypothetical protein
MGKYSKQDGQPQPESADSENVLETGSEPTTTGDRSTEEKVGGQGLGQYDEGEEGRMGRDQ